MARRAVVGCCLALALLVSGASGAAADDGGDDCGVLCTISDGISGIGDGLASGFSSVVDGFGSAVSGIGSAITGGFEAIIQPLWDTGKSVLRSLFVPSGGFGSVVQPIRTLVEATPLKYPASLIVWLAGLPSALVGSGSACPALSLGQAPSFDNASACSVLGLAGGAGDWSIVRQLVRVAFWAFFLIILYRSITRLMAGV